MSRDPGFTSLLDDARRLLAAGRFRAADDAFGRVLLHDPEQPEARAGRAQTSAALAEERRQLDLMLDAARRAAAAGDAGGARALAEEVMRGGGDRDAALALLDGLDAPHWPGVVVSARDTGVVPLPTRPVAQQAKPRAWRRTLTIAWALGLTLVATVAVAGWETHVARLTRAPRPDAHLAPPATHYPAPTAGEQAVTQARAELERGAPARALQALATVRPEDPAYPLARQLRSQAERALGASEAP